MLSSPIVAIAQGSLQGSVGENCRGGKFYRFTGLPYAEPPIGSLRFKGPRPPKPWAGVFDATKECTPCRQRDPLTQQYIGSEDCLYLNVFTPELGAPLRPVLLFIHGGAFVEGSNDSSRLGPKLFLTENVVLVTINYRLGPLGQLGFSDPTVDAPGNNGLKDCVAALKWLQCNIEAFGGNPNNVTIFGESAGSATCCYLLLSHSARGLFHRAILQSGSANSAWASTKAHPQVLAQKLGYEGDLSNQKAIYDFLIKVPGDKLADAHVLVEEDPEFKGKMTLCPWAPIIEVSGCPTESNFITKDPMEIIKSGDALKVPLIIGYNADEGLLMFSRGRNASALLETTDFEKFVPGSLRQILPTGPRQELGVAIKNFYYGDKNPSKDNHQPLVNYFSDTVFIYHIMQAAKALSRVTPVYLYRFNVDLPYSTLKKMVFQIPYSGCTHAEEIPYMFDNSFLAPDMSDSPFGITCQRFIKFWTNFAKTGNPNSNDVHVKHVEWPKFSTEKEEYLDFELELTIKSRPEAERIKFWEGVAKKVMLMKSSS